MPNPRLEKLKKQIGPETLLFISNPKHIAYLTGFGFLVPEEREAFLAVTPKSATLMHVSFSPSPQQNGFTICKGLYPTQIQKYVSNSVEQEKITQLVFDDQSLFVNEHAILIDLAKKYELSLAPQKNDFVAVIRMEKDQTELTFIEQASEITTNTLNQIKPLIKEGVSELDVKRLLEQTMIELGSEQPAFPTIVAFGPNTALPHHQPGKSVLKKNTAVLLDFGASVGGYRSDMTRSWWFGNKPNEKYVQIKTIVDEAYQKALTVVTNPTASDALTARDIDTAARAHISQQGFGQYFIHTTGHGLGLDIHESPSLSSQNTTPIKKNMVITIEPGIYIPDEFGYRYENTLIVTASKPQVLTII